VKLVEDGIGSLFGASAGDGAPRTESAWALEIRGRTNQMSPKFIAPRQRGDTFREQLGPRTLWRPSLVFGGGAGVLAIFVVPEKRVSCQ